jgi:predicted nuclease of predicted toxin-antitoxin system
VALKLYLDDCANADLLALLLTQAGHTVVRPADAGTSGEEDDVHLAYAVKHGLVLVTKDPDDFHALHLLAPNHTGIFGVYQDNDVTRDMKAVDIVMAIERIEHAAQYGYPIAGEFHNLNLWR